MPSLLRNFFYNALLTAANLVFPLVLFIYVSRIIGPAGLGKVGFVSSVASYFLVFGSFGIGNYGIREIARVRGNPAALKKTFNELFVINAATIALALMAYAAFFAASSRLRAEPQLYLINGLSIALALFSFDWLFQGLEDYRFIALRSILVKVASIGLMFVFVRRRDDYVVYALVSVLGLSANYLFNAYFAHRSVGFSFTGLSLRRHVPSLVRFALISVASSLYLNLDKLMLGFLSGDYAVGLYAPAEKMTRLALSLVTALAAVFYPRMVHTFARGTTEQVSSIVSDSFHALLLLALPMFVGLELLAVPVIAVVSGPEFMSSVSTLRIEALVIIPVSLASVLGVQVLMGSGREGTYLLSILGGAAAFVVTALLCIPALEQDGAALAMVAAETAGVGLQLLWTRKLTKTLPLRWLWPLVLATVIMASVVTGLMSLGLPALVLLPLGVSLGACVYFAVLYLLKDSIMVTVTGKLLSAVRLRRAR